MPGTAVAPEDREFSIEGHTAGMSSVPHPMDRDRSGSTALMAGGKVRRSVWRMLPFAVLVALAATAFVFDVHKALSLDSFIQHRATLAAWVNEHLALSLISVMVIYTAVVALSLPCGLVLTLMSGFLFGPILGGLAAAASATAGATILFLGAKSCLGDSLRRKLGPQMERFACGFCKDSFNYLLFLRLVPVAPFWLVNLAPAVMGVRTRSYVLATAIGILPATFVFATLGAGLDSVIAAQEAANADCIGGADCAVSLDPGALITPQLVMALTAFGLLSLMPVGIKYWRARRGSPS